MVKQATVSTGSVEKFQTMVLENEFMRVVVIPRLGGRVWELQDRKRQRQWIWHRGDVPLSVSRLGAKYDDVWAGGWEELFPNDAPGEFEGRRLPDHGEWWTTAWSVAEQESGSVARLKLVARTNVIRTRCSKEFMLPAGSSRLMVKYYIQSEEQRAFHFLFKQHLAVGVSAECRLRLPGGRIRPVDPGFSDIVKENEWSEWPNARGKDGAIADLQNVPPSTSESKDFIYVKEFSEPWCGVADIEKDASLRLEFDGEKLRFVWLFLAYGGWRNVYTAVLEPCTNWPKDLEEAVNKGSAAELEPGGEFTTSVILAVGPNDLTEWCIE